MGFGWAGAAKGASDALQAQLVRAFQQKMAQEQFALQQQRAAQGAAQFDASLGLQRQQLASLDEDRKADRAFREQQAQRVVDEKDASKRTATNAAEVRRLAIDGIRQRTAKPRDAQLMAASEGVDIPMDILDPDKEKRDKLEVIAASQRGNQPKDRIIPVETVEGGRIVTKYLPESQVAGRTFDKPSKAMAATGAQKKVLGFFNRAKEASEIVDALEADMTKAGAGAQLQQQYAPNFLQTDKQQSYRQAQRSFTEARLRKESGAAIPDAEYETDAKTYFAQPGDSPATLAQKKQMREAVLQGIAFEAGPAYEEYFGEAFTPPSRREGSAASAAPASGAPQVGQTKVFPNGRKATWDGKGWVAQ
jgi:hypothetical protein